MKLRNQFCLLLISLLTTSTFAHQFYRHVPFTAAISQQDKITVDYSLANSAGITCISNTPNALVSYAYRGEHKQAKLPAIIQGRKAPTKPHEILADSEGQFSLSALSNNSKQVKFSCRDLSLG